jgi:GTP-binding protein EngB required for normal cell division
VNQIVRYYQAVSDGRFGRLKARSVGSIDQQIKDITKDVITKLENPHDEVFFYGFGRGAYIVRAVAALLHYMGMPKDKNAFEDVYSRGLELEKANSRDDSLNGTKILSQLKVLSNAPPIIRFVGLFDTVRPSLEKHQYDISFVSSIQILRHALAFNETSVAPEMIDTPTSGSMEGRSMVQAWFVGAHQDLGGGTERDGLSLHSYQWMLLESIYAGIIVQPDSKDKFLELAFPQFMGQPPTLGGEEKIEWRLRYSNDINVTMFDLQSLHTDNKSDGLHNIHLGPSSRMFNSQRKIWNNSSKGLLGWNESGPWGTIIHPSVYSILDRNPKMYDQGLFKLRKIELGDFQERGLASNNELAPWLEGLQLQASGVKAFRILVCGKTGVGKSTLINKVFGVEMTEESNTYTQGVHDINQAFESPNHPGLLIHDSRGWQAGSDQELDLIAKFLRHRAFQKDPAESLHVIWFCVDSDVSRIEEADKRTFETIAQYSHHVPVFVVGTKKDKLVAYRKMEMLDQYMKQTNDYKEASRLATLEADKLADEQFGKLRDQLSQIEHYKADGYCSISKGESSIAGQMDRFNNACRRRQRRPHPPQPNPRPHRRRTRTSLLRGRASHGCRAKD